MEIPLLRDIVVIFGLSVGVLWLCNRLKIPTIVGFLFTGVICGPHSLGLVRGISDVETLAKIGIMLLLFTIGLEFSLKRLLEIKRFFLIGGTLQVGLTILGGMAIAEFLQRPIGEALLLGFLFSMSSTAIVLKAFESQDSTDSMQGQLSIGILIFQDIVAVPMMLLTPALSDSGSTLDTSMLTHLFLGLVIIFLVFLAAIKVVPRLLYHVAKTRSRELFSLSVLAICFAVAWLASSIGLSLAIGAFLAGLIISESEYRYEALGNILPLQDVFSSLFFVSIGMVLDIGFVFAQPFTILFIAIGIMLMKFTMVAIAAFVLGLPLRVMILAGMALCQIGEFAFVLAKTASEYSMGSQYYYQLFLAVSLLTMVLTPSLIHFSHLLTEYLMHLPFLKKYKQMLSPDPAEAKKIHKDHIVIIGFGLAGRNLARASKEADLPYLILEMNPETVKKEKLNGEPIHFGDATHEFVLQHLHIAHAKAVALMINDPHAARRIVPLVRKLNPNAYLIVRTRYQKDIIDMTQLGATDVIADEFGTSVEIFVRVLQHYQIPHEKIHGMVTVLRTGCHEVLLDPI